MARASPFAAGRRLVQVTDSSKCAQVADSTFYLSRTVLLQRGYVRMVTHGFRETNEMTSMGFEMIRAMSNDSKRVQ